MYLIKFHAKPKPESRHARNCSGAYVNCWIDFAAADGAKVLARHFVEKNGWVPSPRSKTLFVSGPQNGPARRLSREAKTYGYSLAFYCYPNPKSRRNK